MFVVNLNDNSITEMELHPAIKLIYPDWRVEHYDGVDRVWTGCFGLGRRRFTCRSRSLRAAQHKTQVFMERFLEGWFPTEHMPYVFFLRRAGAEYLVNSLEKK